jgi:hypothetical protein
MKTKTTLLILAAGAGLLGAIMFAAEKTHSGAASHAKPPHEVPATLAAEMKAFHEKALAAYDVDKNGKLDQDERAVLHDHVRGGKFSIPAAVRHHIAQAIGHHGNSASLPPEILAKYDTNKDGKLDEKEHVAFAVDIAAGLVQPPHSRHAAPAAGEKKTSGS